MDLAPLIAGEETTKLVRTFAKAYGETGFGYIINHGVDPALQTAVFDVSKQFHALPVEVKNTLALDAAHRGYIAINTSTDVTTNLAQDDVGGLQIQTPAGEL